jgi:hypothetical protein
VQPLHLPGGAEENHRNLSHGMRSWKQYLNSNLPNKLEGCSMPECSIQNV